MKKNIFFVLILLFSTHLAKAQFWEWDVTVNTFADNREYFSEYNHAQTILAGRLDLEAGLKVDSFNRLRAGIDYLHEYGSPNRADQYNLRLYFSHSKPQSKIFLGIFPRQNKLDYPLAMLTDTLTYFRPLMEGGWGELSGEWGYQRFWIDWTSRQTDTIRETFLFGFSGRFQLNAFYLEHHFLMHHFAGAAKPVPDDHIRDNGGLHTALGTNLSRLSLLDSLCLQAGLLMGIDRTRGIGQWNYPKGLLAEFYAKYRRFGLRNTYYHGKAQDLMWGDLFYTADKYNRLDLFVIPVISNFVDNHVQFSMHFIDGEVNFSQQIIFIIALNESRKVRR